MQFNRYVGTIAAALACLVLGSGCSSDSTEEFWTACGAVIDGEYVNPLRVEDGEEVTVTQVASESRVAIRNEDGETLLIKLIGVFDVPPEEADPAAIQFLLSLSTRAYFYIADEECTFTSAGSVLYPGTLLTRDGRSFGEELLGAGFGTADTRRQCGSDRVNNCYAALEAGTPE